MDKVYLDVWGDRAVFTRPELKVERMTYDVMTPSAARGILDSIYWHPGLWWCIDRIFVGSPIKTESVRRNEVKSKASASGILDIINKKSGKSYISSAEDRQQRLTVFLKDVHYLIEAHAEMTCKEDDEHNPAKYHAIFVRRSEKGQCYRRPCFGCRECPVSFRRGFPETFQRAYIGETIDLGVMLYDLDYKSITKDSNRPIEPFYFHAIMKDGIIDVFTAEVLK